MDGAPMEPTVLDKLMKALEKSELLTAWERNFLESLQEQFNKRGKLSARQLEIYERIEKNKLSVSAVEKAKLWQESYSDEHRRIARICAEYYEKAGYFNTLVDNILSSEDYIPTEKSWRKMCENKYAKKVIAEHNATPKYAVGTLVLFRSTADCNMKNASRGMPCVVLSAGGKITSAAKGAKPYKVLPFGAPRPIECEERHIKLCKNPKKAKKVVDNSVPF